MFSAILGDEYKYDLTAPKFKTAFTFLKRGDLAGLKEGWYELENGVRASVQHYETAAPETIDYETHEKYFDIHYMVQGSEMIGAIHRNCVQEKTAYDADADMQYYHDPKFASSILINTGDFVLLAPDYAHKPHCAVGKATVVDKIVIKVPV